MSSRERITQWRQRVAGQRKSGLTVEAYCQQQGVAISSFYSWKQQLRALGSAAAEKRQGKRARPALAQRSARFVPLALSEAHTDGSIAIECRSGLVLRVPCDEQVLRMALAVLGERPC